MSLTSDSASTCQPGKAFDLSKLNSEEDIVEIVLCVHVPLIQIVKKVKKSMFLGFFANLWKIHGYFQNLNFDKFIAIIS